MWKKAIQTELNSLAKHEVFRHVVHTSKGVMPVGYKWVFVWKQNENHEIVQYKAWLVAQVVTQGFSQKPSIDYEENYSLVMDAITFRFLIGLIVSETLDMSLMDVITTYLYGLLDKDIHMEIPKGFKMPEAFYDNPINVYSIKL